MVEVHTQSKKVHFQDEFGEQRPISQAEYKRSPKQQFSELKSMQRPPILAKEMLDLSYAILNNEPSSDTFESKKILQNPQKLIQMIENYQVHKMSDYIYRLINKSFINNKISKDIIESKVPCALYLFDFINKVKQKWIGEGKVQGILKKLDGNHKQYIQMNRINQCEYQSEDDDIEE